MASSLPQMWGKKSHEKTPYLSLQAVPDLLQWNENRLSILCHPNLIQASVIQWDASHGCTISIAFLSSRY